MVGVTFWHYTTTDRAVTRQMGKLVTFYACSFYTGLHCISCAVIPEDTSVTYVLLIEVHLLKQ